MAVGISIRDFRDHLTDHAWRIERGQVVVLQRMGRSVVLCRAPGAVDSGWPLSMTHLRRQACRAVRIAERRPLLVLWHCQPTLWLGPLPPGLGVERRRPRWTRKAAVA